MNRILHLCVCISMTLPEYVSVSMGLPEAVCMSMVLSLHIRVYEHCFIFMYE